MSPTAPQTTIDPLGAFIAGGFARTQTEANGFSLVGAPWPMPLVAIRFDVLIDGGLAVVTTSRAFRNAESQSIEATITFPVPVHATLFDLAARVGERLLIARARRRRVARAEYEGAVDAGKTAVLHEEVLRGVHTLSVAHVPPGVEVEVRSTWALTLTNIEGCGHLRIPLTVGDIYGRSKLPDSDDLVHGGLADVAQLNVDCRAGSVTLQGVELCEGRAKVPLNAPIDLTVSAWTPRALNGYAADGRAVSLRVEPAPGADCALDVAILVDHSGSMGEVCSVGGHPETKHQAVSRGLHAIARRVTTADRIDLWEFDGALDHVGSNSEPDAPQRGREAVESRSLLALVRALKPPCGGTEIGRALAGVMAQSLARDLLLITDGKSNALDVQALARSGRRVCVVLIGEDSLEANVGHLSALTGGEIFVAAGNDLTAVFTEAFRSLRVPYSPPEPVSRVARSTSTRRGGMTITASWSDGGSATAPTIEMRGVTAVAASLLLPTLSTEDAAALAEDEGLVTHLTSLLLIDEAGDIQQTVPAMRKVPLPSPRTHMAWEHKDRVFSRAVPDECYPSESVMMMRRPDPAKIVAMFADDTVAQKIVLEMMEGAREEELQRSSGLGKIEYKRKLKKICRRFEKFWAGEFDQELDLSSTIQVVDWDLAPQKLLSGDLSMLASAVERAIRKAATNKDVVALARTLDLDPVVLVVGLLAHAARSHRTAARIARAIFGGKPPAETSAILRQLGIERLPA
jgi:hypothetical protein